MSNPVLKSGTFRDGHDAERLAWWPRQRLDDVGRAVQETWTAWMRDWISASASLCDGGACTQAHEYVGLGELHWDPIGTRGGAAAWIEARFGNVERIQDAIFGAEPGPAPVGPREGIALAVAARAWAALIDALREVLSLDREPAQPGPAAGVFKPWSGGVLVSPPSGVPLAQCLLLNAECVRGLLRLPETPAGEVFQQPRAGMSALEEALAEQKLLIRAELAGCELDLGELENLDIGDVVPLAHALDEPLTVATSADGPFCAAFLGRQAGRKAIELIRQTPLHRTPQIDRHPQEAP